MDINLTTPLNMLGYGRVGLNVLLALQKLGHDVACWPIGQNEVTVNEWEYCVREAMRGRDLYNQDAPSLRIYHQFDLAQHVGRGLHCGFPIFELNRFTETELHHLGSQDVLFAPSPWACQILSEHVPHVTNCFIPFGVDTCVFFPSTGVEQSETTVFLNVGKWEIRKGHDILVEAFNAAFAANDSVELRMMTQNPVAKPQYNEEWNRLYMDSSMGRAGKIKLVNRVSTQQEVASIMAEADCGVFPARAEGWNMELAEMLACGKICIATAYAGHMAYCHHMNCHLIEPDGLEDAFDGVWFHGQGQWALLRDKAMEQLIWYLRAVHRYKQEGQGVLPVNQGGIDTFKRLTWENTAQQLVKRMGRGAEW